MDSGRRSNSMDENSKRSSSPDSDSNNTSSSYKSEIEDGFNNGENFNNYSEESKHGLDRENQGKVALNRISFEESEKSKLREYRRT
jgi:hypothetical protein